MKRSIRCSLLAGLLGTVAPLPLGAFPAVLEQVPVDSGVREVRELFERTMARQPEIQQLSLAIAMHQSQLLRIDDQLHALRRDLTEFAAYVDAVTWLAAEATREEAVAATPDGRAEATWLRRQFEIQLAKAAERDREMRAREGALTRQRDAELHSWNDLASRLTQLTAR